MTRCDPLKRLDPQDVRAFALCEALAASGVAVEPLPAKVYDATYELLEAEERRFIADHGALRPFTDRVSPLFRDGIGASFLFTDFDPRTDADALSHRRFIDALRAVEKKFFTSDELRAEDRMVGTIEWLLDPVGFGGIPVETTVDGLEGGRSDPFVRDFWEGPRKEGKCVAFARAAYAAGMVFGYESLFYVTKLPVFGEGRIRLVWHMIAAWRTPEGTIFPIEVGGANYRAEDLIPFSRRQAESMALLGLSADAMAKGAVKRGRELAERARQLDPEGFPVLGSLGDLAWKDGEATKACGFWRRAAQVMPGEWSISLRLGRHCDEDPPRSSQP